MLLNKIVDSCKNQTAKFDPVLTLLLSMYQLLVFGEISQELGDRLNALHVECKDLHDKCSRIEDTDAPSVKKLNENFVDFFDEWEVVCRLHEECLKK